MTSLTGIWVPLATPFRRGEIDTPALQALARRLQPDVSGLVVCGTTGEAAALDDAEQLDALDAVLQAVPGCDVVMGLAGNNLRAVTARLKQLQERPIRGVLVPPPYYIRPSQAGLVNYFLALAEISDVPLIVYNIPYRTGVAMEFDTLATIARHPRIVAVKDCGGDPGLTMRLIAETKLQVLAGEDQQLLSTLALGGTGGILASAHRRSEGNVLSPPADHPADVPGAEPRAVESGPGALRLDDGGIAVADAAGLPCVEGKNRRRAESPIRLVGSVDGPRPSCFLDPLTMNDSYLAR